ncbi:hypothetical protein ACN4GL_00185 [Burkholderia pseudomallei]
MKHIPIVLFVLVCAAVIGHTVGDELRGVADAIHTAITGQAAN